MNNELKKIRAWLNHESHTRIVIVVVILSLCIAELVSLQSDVYQARQESSPSGFITLHPSRPNVSRIAPWMTFDYINSIFKLPPHYLQNAFSISDSHYPQITLSRYAYRHNVNAQQFLTDVQHAVSAYGM